METWCLIHLAQYHSCSHLHVPEAVVVGSAPGNMGNRYVSALEVSAILSFDTAYFHLLISFKIV